MDPTKENTVVDLEDLLKELTVPGPGYSLDGISTIEAQDTITLGTDSLNSFKFDPSGHVTYTSSTWNPSSLTMPQTITTGTTGTTAPWFTSNPTGAKIQLDGDNADVTVNGWSLVDAVKRIEQRLGLFQPNPELEKEWEDLQSLGEQYRKLEQHIKDKQATFDRIKAMPAPDID